jgi:hypothetical protein
VDESGADRHDNIRKYGYSLRGTTPVSCRFFSRGRRTNIIAAMSVTRGIIATDMHSSTINGNKFYDFVRGTLIPNMLPSNGFNHHSVVIPH